MFLTWDIVTIYNTRRREAGSWTQELGSVSADWLLGSEREPSEASGFIAPAVPTTGVQHGRPQNKLTKINLRKFICWIRIPTSKGSKRCLLCLACYIPTNISSTNAFSTNPFESLDHYFLEVPVTCCIALQNRLSHSPWVPQRCTEISLIKWGFFFEYI